ncbi:MAG: alpha/beta hydrolase [Acidobacteriota bacterium]|nr:alpha/beta hydrolase [Acidobacteriota bacterium]
MTRFLDVRLHAVGGELAVRVSVFQGTTISDYTGMLLGDFLAQIRGRHVFVVAHGFNVNRADGIACLAHWETLLQLQEPAVFVGLLWPGDSVWAHGLDYPSEPRVANNAGQLIAQFLDANFGGAASISLASHSLGARVVLETAQQMKRGLRGVIMMAPAIDDNCLTTEFSTAAANAGTISVLASRKDSVLSGLFPLGNFFAGILTVGHPWWHAALGHTGPASPAPANFVAPFEISDSWNFSHGDYLKIAYPSPPQLPLPTVVAPDGSYQYPQSFGPNGQLVDGWQAAFTAAFASTRLR